MFTCFLSAHDIEENREAKATENPRTISGNVFGFSVSPPPPQKKKKSKVLKMLLRGGCPKLEVAKPPLLARAAEIGGSRMGVLANPRVLEEKAPVLGSEKVVIWNRVLFNNVHWLKNILENVEILDLFLSAPRVWKKQGRIRPFSRDSREFIDSGHFASEQTAFVMTPLSIPGRLVVFVWIAQVLFGPS